MVGALLDLGLDLDVWPWVWLAIAVIFALVELVLVGGSFIVLPWAASAFIASVLAFYDASIEIQWMVFVFGGAAMFTLLYRWAQRFARQNTMDPGVGADRLIGLTAIVTAPIVPHDVSRGGRVSVSGEPWAALTEGHRPLDIGARARVIAVQGTRVIVEPVEAGAAPAGEEA